MRSEIGRWIADRLSTLLEKTQPRVIMGPNGKDPYLSRYYLFGKPVMPDGSPPFDKFGNPKPGARWNEQWGLYVHCFHRDDADREMHDHPFKWMLSFVIAGGYREERRVGLDDVTIREVKPLSFNFLTHDDFHRVDLVEHDAWTLFLVGPKVGSWGFWNRETGAYTPWREFLAKKQEREMLS